MNVQYDIDVVSNFCPRVSFDLYSRYGSSSLPPDHNCLSVLCLLLRLAAVFL